MKISIAVKALSNHLKQLRSVVDSGATIPVYKYVKLTSGQLESTLTACDPTATLEVVVKATSDVTGTILLPARLLQEIIAPMAAQDVTLETEEGSPLVKLTAGKYRAKLTSLPAESFPKTDEDSFEVRMPACPRKSLCQLAERVSFAASEGGSRYTISTALLESDGKLLHLVATDGNCLVLASLEAEAPQFALKLPKTALELFSVLEGGETLEISESEQAFRFCTPTETLTVRKTSGEFPPYRRIIPSEHATQMKVTSEALSAAVESAIPFTRNEKKETATIHFAVSGTSLTVKGEDSSLGLCSDDVTVESTGPDAEFLLNPALLKAFLDRVQGDLVISTKETVKGIVDFQAGPLYRFLIAPKPPAQTATKK